MDIVCFFGGHVTLPGQSATGIQRPITGFNDFGAKSVETKMPDVDARKKSVTVCFGTGLERGGLWLDGWIVPPLLPLLPTCQQTVVAVSHSKHVEIFLLKNELKRFTFLQQFHNSMETRTWNLDKVNWIWMLKLARKWENGMNPLLQVSRDHRSGPGYQCVGCWRSCCGRWGGAPPSECAAQCPTSSWSSGSLSGWGFCIFPPDPPPAGWVSSCEL